MGSSQIIPPLPAGYKLDVPPLPPGYQLDIPALPPGYKLDDAEPQFTGEASPEAMSAHKPMPARKPGEPGITATKPSFLEQVASPLIGTPGERTILGRAIYGQEATPQAPDYGRGYNLPAVRLEEFIPPGTVPGEFARGILKAGSELTTPETATLLAGIGGLTAAGGKVLAQLVSAGFAVDMAKSLYEQAPEFKKAVDAGDYNAAANLAGQMTATGAFAGLAGRHATKGLLARQPLEFTTLGKIEPPKGEITSDTQNVERLPSQERVRQEPVETKPVESTGREETPTGRILQEPQEIIPPLPEGYKLDREPVAEVPNEPVIVTEPAPGRRPRGDAGDRGPTGQPAESLLPEPQTPEDRAIREFAIQRVNELADEFSQGFPTKEKGHVIPEEGGQGYRRWEGRNIEDIPVAADVFYEYRHGPDAIANALKKRSGKIWDRLVAKAEEYERIKPKGEAYEGPTPFGGEPDTSFDVSQFEAKPPTPSAQTQPISIADFSKELAIASERSKGEAANEIVGKLGDKILGGPKNAGDLEGTPLFPKQEEPGLFGSSAGQQLQPVATPGPTSLPPKSQQQIIKDMASGLKLPIRFGRLLTPKFGGYFLKVQNLIASKHANDVPTVSHEAGHKLDSTFSLSQQRALIPELDRLGDPSTPDSRSSWTKSKTLKYKYGEGVAEFTRYWLTDPAKARSEAPNTTKAFEAALDANKDFGDVMRQAQSDIQTWRTAEPQARLRSHISVGDNPNKTRYTASQLTRDVVDDLHFLRLAMDDANKGRTTKLPPTSDIYLQARLLRGSYGMADTFIRSGSVDFKTKAVTLGTSLEDALKPVAGRMNDFRDWIVAKQAQELHRQGKETGLVREDVNFTAAKFDADPAFQDAWKKVDTWQESLLDYAMQAGLVTPEGAVAMRLMNKHYVPFHRVFEVGAGESPAVEGAGTGRGLNLGTPGSLRKRRGSTRPIVDPLETMVKNAYTLITASEKQAINLSLADLFQKEGMGKWVEKIGIPKDSVKVGIEKLREQLEDLGADLENVPDDAMLQFFQTARQAPFGENIIRITRQGKPEFYRLNKDLFETFHALDLDDAGSLIRMLAAPTQMLRAGVTLAPDFALANAMRDAFSSAIVSKHGLMPFEAVIRGTAALINNPKLVSEFKAAGGHNAVEASYFDRGKLQKFLAEKITKLTPAERALVIVKSPLVALRELSAYAEEATRIGEYQKAFSDYTKAGMPEGEARRLAAFESRDRQDFAKGGAKTKILRHLAAFWNAGLQANVRLLQSFKNQPVKTTLRGLAFITTAKMIEQGLNWDDKDYWDRPQWERDLFFMIPIGKHEGHTRFLRIPTPFEPGIIFGTFPGRLLQTMRENAPEAMKSFPELVLRQGIPNPIPQSVMLLFEDFMSGPQGWDMFRGRPIVPDSLARLPEPMQWTEQTSLTARKVGKILGVPPMKVDHIIARTTGGLGQQITHQVLDRALEAAGQGQRASIGKVPFSRFVTTRTSSQSASVEEFYTRLESLRKKQAGLGFRDAELRHMDRVAAEMNRYRKLSKLTKDPANRRQWDDRVISLAQAGVQQMRANP